jgi:[ribosomal protein S5]-alanine N-acetyltransferase
VDSTLFTTRRLTIRKLRETDLDAFHQYRADPEITKYQGFDTFTRQQALDFIRQQESKRPDLTGEWLQFAIEISDRQLLVGDCAIHIRKENLQIADTGITIAAEFQRKGYASEVMSGLLNYLFLTRKVLRVVETVDAQNIASIQLMKKLGFRQEGYFVDNIFFKGKWGSEIQFALLRKEWNQHKLIS